MSRLVRSAACLAVIAAAVACEAHEAADGADPREPALPEAWERVGDEDLARLLNRLRVLAEVDSDSEAARPVRVIGVAGESGDAGLPSGETRTLIYIAVSDFGEHPRNRLYRMGPEYAPELEGVRIDADGTPVVQMRLLRDHGWEPAAFRITADAVEEVAPPAVERDDELEEVASG